MKPGRNDPCVCGSGKKYKKCCQEKLEAHPATLPQPPKPERPAPGLFAAMPTPAECSQLTNLMNSGRNAELESSSRLMLQRYPSSGFIMKSLGISLRRQGKDSLQILHKASELMPDDAEVHFQLGSILEETGRTADAERSYRRAIKAQPNFAGAHFSLASLLYAHGQFMLALHSTIQSLRIREVTANKSFFVTCVKHLQFGNEAAYVRANLARALTEPWGRPSELAETSAILVKMNPVIEECIILAIRSWPRRLTPQDLFQSIALNAVAEDKLLRVMMQSTVVCDMELERLLTTCREALLDAATTSSPGTTGESIVEFFCALASQCFINEYIYVQHDEESKQANDLRNRLIGALETNATVPLYWPLAVAAYFPLYSLPNASRLLERQWPDAVEAVLTQQVREPLQELQERGNTPRLTDIDGEVSLLVQSQYEENPYPRWISMPSPGEPMTIDAKLRQFFPSVPFKPAGNCPAPEILVAGCGTGQHSIGTTQKFQGAHTLAIDLSMSSLSYAKRKTREKGVTSIAYAQADIMKLGTLNRRFDVIESCGVLHHLADPWAGWRVLVSLLRPDGFMRLSFYSALARREITRTRAFIAEQGYGSSAEEIRRCRQDMMAPDKAADFARIFRFSDFYSTSECRDLLFHVQEHCMTIPEIGGFLRENGLSFLGFEIGSNTLSSYHSRFPDDRTATDLDNWDAFETEHPDTFIGMYNFWVQKTAKPEHAGN